MAQTASDFSALWRATVARHGPRPFLTYQDLDSGERIELSYATMDNWVSKTANMIENELAADPGSRILLFAPPHWMTAVWAIAPLRCGTVVAPWGDPKEAEYVVAGSSEEQLARGREVAGERYALSLLPLGRPFPQVPEGYLDYVAEVRVHGDRFGSGYAPPTADSPALAAGSDVLTHRDLLERCADGYQPEARVLIRAEDAGTDADGLISWVYAPIAAGGSVVLVRGGSTADIARLAEVERATLVG